MERLSVKYPLKFSPILKQTIWGGGKIVQYLGLESDMERVGECWLVSAVEGFLSQVSNGPLAGTSLDSLTKKYGAALLGEKNFKRFGAEFPLLVKYIDAAQKLSVQVHPNDELAGKRHGCKGKTEMWYVLGADKGSSLYAGFSRDITKAEYNSMSAEEIISTLQHYDVNERDMFYLPAGTIHSIGAGAFIAEIQQTSDITYRIYDYDRKDADGKFRELHTQLASEAIDFTNRTPSKIEVMGRKDGEVSGLNFSEVVTSNKFTSRLMALGNLESEEERDAQFNFDELDSFVILMCTSGGCRLRYNGVDGEQMMEIETGDLLLLPADLQSVTFVMPGNSKCEILETHI